MSSDHPTLACKRVIWVVYLLQCSDGTLYTGITNNLQRRVDTHNAGKGAKYTRCRLPVVLLGYVEVSNKSKALSMEHRVKKLRRKAKLDFFNIVE